MADLPLRWHMAAGFPSHLHTEAPWLRLVFDHCLWSRDLPDGALLLLLSLLKQAPQFFLDSRFYFLFDLLLAGFLEVALD